jgi:hypothetical protein
MHAHTYVLEIEQLYEMKLLRAAVDVSRKVICGNEEVLQDRIGRVYSGINHRKC